MVGPNRFHGFDSCLPLTFAQIRDFIKYSLTHEQKQQIAQVWGGDFHIYVATVENGNVLAQLISTYKRPELNPITYAELLKRIEHLPEERMTGTVYVDTDRPEHEAIYHIEILNENFINMCDDCAQPLSEFTDQEKYNGEPEDFEADKERALREEPVYKAGTILMNTGGG